jgi:F-type H+-transporting ATPase subunit epsilon
MIHFELVTLDGVKFRQSVYEVQLPTPNGYIGVFEYHSPLVSLASPGIIRIRHKAGEPDDLQELIATNGGVIEIGDNAVRVLVDEADLADEINEKEIEEAHKLALKMRENAKDQVSLDHAQSLIDRQAVRLKVAELKRHRRRR